MTAKDDEIDAIIAQVADGMAALTATVQRLADVVKGRGLEAGPQGIQGEKGPKGDRGEKGDPGRDAE